jgi:pimeloyl-ACP methyl ester carboxylesterase
MLTFINMRHFDAGAEVLPAFSETFTRRSVFVLLVGERTMRVLQAAGILFLLGSATRFADDPGKGHTFDSKGVKIHYTVEGQGEPVVLIHGAFSSADLNWRLPGTITALAAHYQVIALDVRGHGHSDKPAREEDYGVEMAEDVIRLLDHLKIKTVHIVGYSMGGMIAMKMVTQHPDRARSLTLGGMGWFREGSRLQEFWERIPERERGRGSTPSVCLRSFGKLAVSERELKAVSVPVSILIGDRDPCRRMYVAPVQQVRADWPVTLIDDAGHVTCVVKKQFRDELERALAQHSR